MVETPLPPAIRLTVMRVKRRKRPGTIGLFFAIDARISGISNPDQSLTDFTPVRGKIVLRPGFQRAIGIRRIFV